MPDDAPLSDAERELAGRRRDLEREFDAKVRELKSQTKRLADRLEEDRREWEEVKRRQAKELADKAEQLNRRVDNRAKADEAKVATKEDVDELRLRVRELDEKNLSAKTANTRLEERLAKTGRQRASAQALATATSAIALVASLMLLVVSAQEGDRFVQVAAALLAGATVLLMVLHWRRRGAHQADRTRT